MIQINIYPWQEINTVDRELLGHFVEQYPGNIPGGIFMPGHALSDEDGFRRDVLDAMRAAGVTQLRWAGNFSSHYHWLDGVGPKEARPRKINFAWPSEEDNRHGTAEFVTLCRKVGAEPVIGVNMGSGTAEEAMNWVEYCNGIGDTYFANLRRSHGYEEPFDVRYWCLGNEMYGCWQYGSLSAQEYAKKAEDFAHAMRRVDPTIRLTAVGLETDPEWNFVVSKKLMVTPPIFSPECGNYMDYLSAHYYPIGNGSAYTDSDYDTRMTLGMFFHECTMLMRAAIEAATEDHETSVGIAWDEWNPMGTHEGSEYTLEMALWSAVILNSFIRDSRYVKKANYTFFVGGNGPVRVLDDGLLFQPEYDMFCMYAELFGNTLIHSYDDIPKVVRQMPADNRWPQYGRKLTKTRQIPLIDYVVMKDLQGRLSVFAINLSHDEAFDVRLCLCDSQQAYQYGEHQILWNADLRAKNTVSHPDKVRRTSQKIKVNGDGSFQVKLLPHSVNAIRLCKEM